MSTVGDFLRAVNDAGKELASDAQPVDRYGNICAIMRKWPHRPVGRGATRDSPQTGNACPGHREHRTAPEARRNTASESGAPANPIAFPSWEAILPETGPDPPAGGTASPRTSVPRRKHPSLKEESNVHRPALPYRRLILPGRKDGKSPRVFRSLGKVPSPPGRGLEPAPDLIRG